MSYSNKIFIASIAGFLSLFLLSAGSASADIIGVNNLVPEENPCDSKAVPDDVYKDFKKAVGEFLESPVLADIVAQVKEKTKSDKKVPVDILAVDEAEFKNEYANDVDELYPEKDKAALEGEAEDIYGERTAYAYITETVQNGVQKLKVKFFCQEDLRIRTMDNDKTGDWKLFRQLIHEFVHVKLYSMLVLGLSDDKLPFQDHDEGFQKEEERLFDKLKGWIAEKRAKEAKEATNLDENINPSDLGVGDPRILPDSPLYVFKGAWRGIRMALTFNPVSKAELWLKFSNEKLMEAKELSEKKPEVLVRALENYKIETDKLKEAVEKIPVGEIGEQKVDRFMDKFVDNTIKQQKLFGKFEKELPPEIYEDIEKSKEENLAKFSDIGLQLASAPVFGEKIEKTIEIQSGSDFKQFKNLEVLQAVEEKVPEPAKPAIRQAIENSLNRLKADMEEMPSEDRAKFQDYAENIGGNETRHLAIMDEFERKELTQIVREESEKAKERILERVGTRLKEYQLKELDDATGQYLDHLTQYGRLEDLRIIKEMENSLPSEVSGIAMSAGREAAGKAMEVMAKAETPEQQKQFFEKIENKYHDVQQLEVFKEIEALIPPENKELYQKLMEKVLTKMKEEVERTKTANAAEKPMILDTLAGDSPEHIKILEEFKINPPFPIIALPPEIIQQTLERIAGKAEIIDDPEKLEMLKYKLQESGIKNVLDKSSPKLLGNIEEKSETAAGSVKPEQAKWQIQQAREMVNSVGKLFSMLSPEIQKELEKSNYPPLMEAAKKHLEKAEKVLADGNYGEAFGQAVASLNNSTNARDAILKATTQKETMDARNEQWREFLLEIKEKIPEAHPYPVPESGMAMNLSILIACPIPPVPAADSCEGKWEIKPDSRNCPYFACVGETKELPCAGEGAKVNRNPSYGPVNQNCCPGLNEIMLSESYSVCKKAVSGVECRVDTDCPQSLCSGITSKCYEGRCVIPACIQSVVPPIIPPAPTPTPVSSACPKPIRLEELFSANVFAIGPDGVCKRFFSICSVPENWKRIEKCPETTFAPDMIGCCLQGPGMCVEATKEKCLAAGGQGVPASYCDIADICFWLAAPLKMIIAPSPTSVPSPTPVPSPTVCIQVITPAIGPDNICKNFPTPCDVPSGWKRVDRCPETKTIIPETINVIPETTKVIPETTKVIPETTIQEPVVAPAAECRSGETKDYTCPDGTRIPFWCDCPDWTNGKWNCDLQMWAIGWASGSLKDPESAAIKICPAAGDVTPPVISNVKILDTSPSLTQIMCDTDGPAYSWLEYGLTNSYGFKTAYYQYLKVSQHTLALMNLQPNTAYHFRVAAKDLKGNIAHSDDYTFTTNP